MNSRGFTLIELLVVIAIIGILSSVVMASLNTARIKARDTKRVGDLRQIRTALELFYNTNGFYPQARGDAGCSGWDCNGYALSGSVGWAQLATDLAPYLKTLPTDPIETTGCTNRPWIDNCFHYSYGNVGRNVSASNPTGRTQYDLTAQFEDDNHSLRCGVKNYGFYFDNQNWCGPYPAQVYEASLN